MTNKRTKFNKTLSTLQTNFSLIAEPTQSGALVASNDDLLTEILVRLPVTSILRFKSISKHWQSLLNHQRFTLSYDSVPVSPGLFFSDLYIPFDIENATPHPFRSFKFYPNRCETKIMQSCNGLLLCRNIRGKAHTHKYYVFNPTTKQFAVIPSVTGGSSVRYMDLAYDGPDCAHYKIVSIDNVDLFMVEIKIYSSDTGKWRISQQSFSTPNFFSPCGNGVYCNGALHWITSGFNLVYFKLDVEKLQTMSMPEKPSRSRGNWARYFGESRDHLHLVVDVHNENPLHFDVYELLSDYSGWFIKYRVELDELPAAYPYTAYSSQGQSKYLFGVADVVKGEEEESTFIVLRTRDKIIKYDVLKKSFKLLFHLPNLYQKYGGDFHRYTQKLSSF